MKKLFLLSFVATLSYSLAFAQCDAVSVEVVPKNPQSGSQNYFGVRVRLDATYTQNVVVDGTIRDESGVEPTALFTLTIPAGYLTAETATNYYSTASTSNALVSISSVSPCPGDEEFIVEDINSSTTSDILANEFDSLNVDFSILSSELGLSTTLSKSDIDFSNLKLSFRSDWDSAKAISAPFLSNSSSGSSNYTFTVFTDGANYFNPTVLKVTSSDLQYFDLIEGNIITIANYTSSNYSISVSTGSYMLNSVEYPCAGQQVVNCMNTIYGQRSWFSVLAFAATLHRAAIGGAVIVGCIWKECIHLIHGPGYL